MPDARHQPHEESNNQQDADNRPDHIACVRLVTAPRVDGELTNRANRAGEQAGLAVAELLQLALG